MIGGERFTPSIDVRMTVNPSLQSTYPLKYCKEDGPLFRDFLSPQPSHEGLTTLIKQTTCAFEHRNASSFRHDRMTIYAHSSVAKVR